MSEVTVRLTTEMTPQAVRMLSYCAVGFLVYGLFLLHQILLTVHLNRIDEQLKAVEQAEAIR